MPSLQPVKVRPVRVNVFAGVVNVEPYATVLGDDGALPEPPPAAYVMF